MEMTIYLDQAFLLNGLVDYLLLTVSGSILGLPLRRKRLLLAGVVGGVYAALSLLPSFLFLQSFFWKFLMAGVLCFLAFGTRRGLLRQWIVLFLLAAAFSGLVLLLTELFSAPKALIGGTVYYPMTFGVLILTAGIACGLMLWGLGRMVQHGGNIDELSLRLAGKDLRLTALRDTGNTLRDPISGCPVLVADWQVLEKCCPELRLRAAELEAPQELLGRILEERPELKPRLIPYKTVGVGHGMLLALRPEEIKIAGKTENLLVAFSPVPVSDGGGYQALLGGKR